MRTSNELSTLYKSIDQKNISESAKETLKKIRLANKNFKGKDEDAQELFIEFFNKLKSSKPVAIKTTQEYKDALKKAQVERGRKMREAKGKPKEPKGEGNEVDANRPAKPFGWRMRGKHNYRKPTRDDISKGRAYYEGRVNRADVKRKKYPMLERGGMSEEVYYVNDFYPNYDEDKIAEVLKANGFKKVRKAKKYGWSNQPDVVLFQGDENKAKKVLEKEFDAYISINEKDWGKKYEDGGYMAKGGELGLNTYKLRAEGLNDFLSFLQTGMYMRMKSFTIEPIGVPEVVVTFVTDASLSEIKSKLKEVQDSHVMLETLKPIDEYTGERDEMMAEGGAIKSRNNETGESFGMVIGSFKTDDDLITLDIRKSYGQRMQSYKLGFDKNGNLNLIGDYGYSLDGSYPDMKGQYSGKHIYAENKKETIEEISKLTNKAFATKIYEYVKAEKMAKGGYIEKYYDKKEDVDFLFKKDDKIKVLQYSDGKLKKSDAIISQQYAAEQPDGTYYPFYHVIGSWDIDKKHPMLYSEDELVVRNGNKPSKFAQGGEVFYTEKHKND